MSTRPATHAGSWYSKDRVALNEQISRLFEKAPKSKKGARIILGPHAGYTYCGQQLAEAYGVWDCRETRRVFILGPSHHVCFNEKALLSSFDKYDTPFGPVSVDTAVCESLTGDLQPFGYMSESADEDEHSFEMHLPFLVQKCRSEGVEAPRIVPVMVSGLSTKARGKIVAALSPYLNDRQNTFVISSDFCHWGRRFGYTVYVPGADLTDLSEYRAATTKTTPIYKSIEFLDRSAMSVATAGSVAKWDAYIDATENTICGQKPIAIVLSLIESLWDENEGSRKNGENGELRFQWLGYSQSNKVTTPSDHSVSYAAGYVLLG